MEMTEAKRVGPAWVPSKPSSRLPPGAHSLTATSSTELNLISQLHPLRPPASAHLVPKSGRTALQVARAAGHSDSAESKAVAREEAQAIAKERVADEKEKRNAQRQAVKDAEAQAVQHAQDQDDFCESLMQNGGGEGEGEDHQTETTGKAALKASASKPPARKATETSKPPVPPRPIESNAESTSSECMDERRIHAEHEDAAITPSRSDESEDDTLAATSGQGRSLVKGLLEWGGLYQQPSSEERLLAQARRKQQERERRELADRFHDMAMVHPPEAIMREFDRRQNYGHQLAHQLALAKEHIKDVERSAAALSDDLQAKDRTIIELQKELATSRSFVEADDIGDVGEVQKSLDVISQAVDDVAFEIAESHLGLRINLDEVVVDQRAVDIITAADQRDHTLLNGFLPRLAQDLLNAHRTLQDYVNYASATIIAFHVQQEIFERFKPSLDALRDEILRSAYRDVRDKEEQARAARWRSITYDRVAPTTDDEDREVVARVVGEIGARLMGGVASPVMALIEETFPQRSPDLSDAEAGLVGIVTKALQWHRRTKVSYLSADYSVIVDLRSRKMGESDRLVAVSGFGLIQSRSVSTTVKAAGGATSSQVVDKMQLLGDVSGWKLSELLHSD